MSTPFALCSATRVAVLAMAATCLTTENAMAAPTTWVYTSIGDRPIISNNDVYVPLWMPGEPELVPLVLPGDYDQFAIRMTATMPGPLVAAIFGNHYTSSTATIRSPALYGLEGLRLEGVTLDGDGGETEWVLPTKDLASGFVDPAFLEQGGSVGQFDLSTFAYDADDYAYIGFADATLTRFGYLQIERASATDITQWRLVGFAYEEAGVPIEVEDLTVIPPAPSALLLAAGMAVVSRRRVLR